MKPIRRLLAASSVAAVFMGSYAPVVTAQQAPTAAPEPAAEEVVVTAQKRSSPLQEVPFSVAAPSEAQIRNSGADSIVDLARNVAGLTISDLGPGQSQIAIRGISSGQVIRDQPGVKEQVGVYLDETPISVALFTPDLVLYDLDRFEVLRGPQGTLFGSGSESGTLRYITKSPRLGKFEGNLEGTLDASAGGDGGGGARGMINVPIGDKAALRAVAYYDRTPGFVDAVQPNGSSNQNVNAETRNGGRISILWKATEDLTIEPRVVLQNMTADGYPRVDLYNILANPYTTTQPAVTLGDRQQFTQQREGPNDEFELTDLKLNYDLGDMGLTSITSYTHRNVTIVRDATQLTGSVTFDVSPGPRVINPGPPPVFATATPADVRLSSALYDRTSLSVLSQELRLASSGTHTVDWLGGLFWQHAGRHYGQNLPTPGYDALLQRLGYLNLVPPGNLEDPPDQPFYSDFHYSLRQYAVFGEATWHVTHQLSGTLGLRYYKFDESRTGVFANFFAGPSPGYGSVSSSGVSPRFIATYKLADDLLLDAQASRGFRLGGINDPINLPLCSASDKAVFGNQKNWADEKNWNYELGVKSQFLNRKVTFNSSIFYTDIKDLQATITAGSCSSRLVFNVPKSRSTGIEAELSARPTSNWDFSVSATWVDAKLTSSVTFTDNAGQTHYIPGLQEGNQLPTAPKFQAVAGLGYNQPLPSGQELFGVFTVQYVGSSFSQFENEAPNFGLIGGCGTACGGARLIPFGGPYTVSQITFDPRLPGYSLGNLRVGLKSNRWEVAGFVNNLWDTTARLALDYERGRSARVGYLTNMSRLVGVTARYTF